MVPWGGEALVGQERGEGNAEVAVGHGGLEGWGSTTAAGAEEIDWNFGITVLADEHTPLALVSHHTAYRACVESCNVSFPLISEHEKLVYPVVVWEDKVM